MGMVFLQPLDVWGSPHDVGFNPPVPAVIAGMPNGRAVGTGERIF
jgi:hypothetical protein